MWKPVFTCNTLVVWLAFSRPVLSRQTNQCSAGNIDPFQFVESIFVPQIQDAPWTLDNRQNTLTTVAETLDFENLLFIGERIISNLSLARYSHGQLGCDLFPKITSLQELKAFLGKALYMNIAIDCSIIETKKILQSLIYTKYNASQLELPRVNILLFEDLSRSLQRDLYDPASLIQNIIKLVPTSRAQCWDCCVESSVVVLHPRIRTSLKVGLVSNTCSYSSIVTYTLNTWDALRGVHIRIAFSDYFPFIIAYMENGEYRISGLCGEILFYLVQHFNFSYNMMPSIDGFYGSRNETTHEWNGLVGMVVNKQADMILTGLTISKIRSEVVDFTQPFWVEPTGVFIRTWEKRDSYFYKPFQWQVWLVISSCLLATIGIAFLFALKRKADFSQTSYSAAISDLSLIFLSTLLLKGEGTMMRDRATRVLWVSFWLMSLVIVTTYAGNLVAALTTNQFKLPFTNLEQLAEDTEYRFTTGRSTFQMSVLEEAEGGIFARLWQKHLSGDVALTRNVNGLDSLMNGSVPFAYAGDKTGLVQHLISTGRCDWMLLPEEILPAGLGIALPKNSPYQQLISKEIISMAQYGFIKRWKEMHFLKPKCDLKKNYGSAPIAIPHVQLFFIAFSGCLCISVFILCVEIMFGEIKKTYHHEKLYSPELDK